MRVYISIVLKNMCSKLKENNNKNKIIIMPRKKIYHQQSAEKRLSKGSRKNSKGEFLRIKEMFSL